MTPWNSKKLCLRPAGTAFWDFLPESCACAQQAQLFASFWLAFCPPLLKSAGNSAGKLFFRFSCLPRARVTAKWDIPSLAGNGRAKRAPGVCPLAQMKVPASYNKGRCQFISNPIGADFRRVFAIFCGGESLGGFQVVFPDPQQAQLFLPAFR